MILKTETNTPPVFAAVLRSGEYWDFHRMEWAPEFTSMCLTSNPDIKSASWGRDEYEVEIREYSLTLKRVYKEKERHAK